MPARARCENVRGTHMQPLLDRDLDLDRRRNELTLVHEWRTEQIARLGVPRLLARAFADTVDWHEVAALVERGCPPLLALEIAI